MGKRREGREAALQFLYQVDVQKEDVDAQLARFWALRTSPEQIGAPNPARDFAEQLLALDQRQRPQVVARELQQIENPDLSLTLDIHNSHNASQKDLVKSRLDEFENQVNESKKKYCLASDYQSRSGYVHYDDMDQDDKWQLEVYLHAYALMKKCGFSKVADIGCGSAYKLMTYLLYYIYKIIQY